MPANYTICTLGTCPLSEAEIGYQPSLGGNVFYLVLFALMLVAQLVLGIRQRTWSFLVGMVGGLLLEIVGYVGRLQLHADPFSFNALITYLVCLTIAPAFLSAAIYVCFRRVIVAYDESVSRINARAYSFIFITSDFICLVLQATGGAITSLANTTGTRQTGINIMIAGLAFQVASLALFILCCVDFVWRLHVRSKISGQPISSSHRGRLRNGFSIGLAIATVTIFIRSIFRVAELQGGFHSSLATNQVAFMILEGLMILIACFCLTVLHPGLCLQSQWKMAKKSRMPSMSDVEL